MALAMVLAWNTAVGRKSFEVYEEGDKVEKIFKEYKEKEVVVEKPKKVEQPVKRKQEIKKGGISALGPNER